MNNTIAITGATGFIGLELVKFFSECGWNVVALVREGKEIKNIKNVTSRTYDLTLSPQESILIGVDYLIHCAYIKGSDISTYKANVDGTKKLLELALLTGIKKSVMLSSLSSKKSAKSIYGKQKYSIEKLFTGDKCAIIRPGLVVGDGGLVGEIYKIIKTKHIIPLIGGGKQPIQITNPFTLSKVIREIIEKDLEGTYTIATQGAYNYKEFYQRLVKTTGTWAIMVPIPYILLLFILRITRFIGLKINISEENLKGLKNIHKIIKTNEDFKKIGLPQPSFEDILTNVSFQ